MPMPQDLSWQTCVCANLLTQSKLDTELSLSLAAATVAKAISATPQLDSETAKTVSLNNTYTDLSTYPQRHTHTVDRIEKKQTRHPRRRSKSRFIPRKTRIALHNRQVIILCTQLAHELMKSYPRIAYLLWLDNSGQTISINGGMHFD